MYNLARYTECIDVCQECLNIFPTLSTDNPTLYFKVLLRKGRANIELGKLAEAQSAYDTLYNMTSDSQQSQVLLQSVSIDQVKQLLSPFKKHLNAKKEYQEKNPEEAVSSEKRDGCEEEMETSDAYSTIHLSEVCYHISKDGRGPCYHPSVESIYPDGCTCPPGTHSEDDDCVQNEQDLSDRNSMKSGPSCESIRRGGYGADVTACKGNKPELVREKEGDYKTDKTGKSANECADDDDDDDEEAIDITDSLFDPGMACVFPTSSVAADWAKNKGGKNMPFEILNASIASGSDLSIFGQGSKSSKSSADAPLDLRSVLRMLQKERENSSKGHQDSKTSASNIREKASAANQTDAPGLKKSCIGPGFKRGFLGASSVLPAEKKLSKGGSNHVSKSLRSQQSYYVACYESDKDNDPLTAEVLAERKNDHSQLLKLEKELQDTNGDQKWAVLRNVLDDVLGKSFRTTRTIDFARIFGHHVSPPGTSKRKKKSCVANCGTCFARKMWGTRFICTDYKEAEDFLKRLEHDPRRNAKTFVPAESWQLTGYYACGYEMAFDVPALVHGVAYICHLQSELHWRGDKVPLLKDIQNSFITSLHRNVGTPSNVHLLLMIYFMLRDTAKLFELFSESSVVKDRCSFQFSHTASNAARSVLSSFAPPKMAEAGGHQLLLSTKTESLAHNSYNWSLLGQMAREEKWIYNFLLRDVSHLIFALRNTVPRQPSYLEAGETFSEAFKKACGERANDERYWECRIVTIVERDRCRMIERNGDIARRDDDLEQSALLYSSAIRCRPQQPRLLFRRAQIRASQRKWRECLSDIRKAVLIIQARHESLFGSSNCPRSCKCLLVDLHILEGDVLLERSQEADDNILESVNAALNSYKEANSHVSKDDVLRNSLNDKILAMSHRADILGSKAAKTERYEKRESEKFEEKNSVKSGGRIGAVSAQISTQKATFSSSQGKPSSANQDVAADYSKRKRRKSHKLKSQAITTPEIISSARTQTESSSEEDEIDSSLIGNPYAALLDGEILNSSSSRKAPTSTTPQKPTKPVSNSSRTKLTQSSLPSNDHDSASARINRKLRTEEKTGKESSLHPTRLPTSMLQCTLCGVSFGSRVDYESHTRGRRHRTAVAKNRAAGTRDQDRCAWKSQQAVPSATSPTRASSSSTVNDEHLRASGPTREEALAEAERAMAILGGEARPCDVVSRMNFSKWHIYNANAYLEKEFGGLLALCQARPDVFELRPGSESRPVLMLINRVRNPRSHRRHGVHQRSARDTASLGLIPPPIVPYQQATSRFSANDSEFPALGSHGYNGASQYLERMMNDLLHVSDGQSTVHGEYANKKMPLNEMTGLCNQAEVTSEDETCGICYDKKPSVRCMPCKHEWCENCIMDNMKRGRMECPMCMGHVSHLESLAGELD